MTPQAQFAAKVQQMIAQAQRLEPEAQRAIMELLNQARQRIISLLADQNSSSFTSWQLAGLKTSIERIMDQFRQDAGAATARLQATAAQLGVQMADAPLAAAGISLSTLGGVDLATLAIAQRYTADLITGLSADAAGKINGVLARLFLGGQPNAISDAIEQVGRALDNGKFSGIFSAIGDRAQAIVVNESLRMVSISGQAKMEDLFTRHPDLKKAWRHLDIARRPRPLHIDADGQVRAVDEPFHVAGEPLMYPRDPAGSPENTINCHCLAVPHFDETDLQPSASQRSLLDRLGISVSVAPAA